MAKAKGLLDWVGRGVDELMKMGYPESVAKRISSGELPMDEASRMARAAEQGYDPRTYYHGGSPDIQDLDTSMYSDMKTYGTGTWFSDAPEVANSYLPKDGTMYPVRIKTGLMDTLDAKGDVWNRIEGPVIKRDGETLSYDGFPYFTKGDIENTDDLARLSSDTGGKGLVIDNVVDIGPNYKMPRETKDDWLSWLLDYEQKGGRNVSVQDPTTVRSLLSAAFDPEYTGPNILGSRIAPTAAAGLLGATALTQSEDAEAAALEAGMPMAMQAGGQSAMDVKPDLGRDTGTILGLMDFLLPLVGEAFKPATMGDAELTDEQRRMRKYYGQ